MIMMNIYNGIISIFLIPLYLYNKDESKWPAGAKQVWRTGKYVCEDDGNEWDRVRMRSVKEISTR